MQLAAGTNTVRIIATVDAAKVESWHLHLEIRVAVLRLPIGAQSQKFTKSFVHTFQRIATQAGVRRMARLALKRQPLHHDALVHTHRSEAGRLSNNRIAGFRLASLSERSGAIRGG